MRYLIDGYNLLYALGVLGARKEPGKLEKARQYLLELLSDAHESETSAVTVVFDAINAPRAAVAEADYQGIHIRFAQRQEADDLIEELIRRAPEPRRLTIVSDDHRIQQAAGRRRCPVLGCGAYLDELDRRRRKSLPHPEASPEPDRSKRPSPQETDRWLGVFADLANDPALKELSDPPEFLDAPE